MTVPDPSTPVDDRLLTSLAILQVNWDDEHRSHLDNFIPFAVEAMRRGGLPDYSDAEVGAAIKEHFGLRLPAGVVTTVLRRVQAQHLGSRESATGRFALDAKKAAAVSISEQEQRYLRRQRNLCESLVAYAKRDHTTDWTVEQAEAALLNYVDANAVALLGTALRGDGVAKPEEGDAFETVVVAGWIQEINRSDAERFDYVVTVVKGTMLASSLLLPNSGPMNRPFQSTSLVLDTPIVLRALGYEGDEAKQAIRETLSLAKQQNASLLVLQRSVNETRRILTSVANGIGKANAAPRAVDQYVIERGLTRADLQRMIEGLDGDIQRLGISITPGPAVTEYYTVDEKALEDELAKRVHKFPDRRDALLHDLDALAAVYRIRERRAGDRLETCRAVLITTNTALVKVSKIFPDFAREDWPIAMTIDHLTTMLWVKKPIAAPDLPRHQLLANCYSALLPSNHLWQRYLETIDRLREADQLTDDQAHFLRYSQEAHVALVKETAGQDDVGADDIRNVIQRYEDIVREPFEEQLELAATQVNSVTRTSLDQQDRAERAERALQDAEDRLRREEEARQALDVVPRQVRQG